MSNNFHDLINKELSRKDFLKFMAGAMLAILGMNNFIAYLLHVNRTGKIPVVNESSQGFGTRKFGV